MLKSNIQALLQECKESDRGRINQADLECAIMHSRQGSHASYNVQTVVDNVHGFIVHAEAVTTTSDYNQCSCRIEQAHGLRGQSGDLAFGDLL